MATFGERLRREREAHGVTIEEISAATGILHTYLEALERDDFCALPGRAFGKLYIRAYAETLGFDPQLLIDEYDREHVVERPVPLEPPAPDSIQPRRVEAVIQRWRRAARAEHSRPADPAASPEVEAAGSPEAPPEMPPALLADQISTIEEHRPSPDDPGDIPVQEPAESPHRLAVEIDASPTGAPVAAASVPKPRTLSWTRPSIVVAALAMGLCACAAWALIALFRADVEPVRAAASVAPARQLAKDPPRVDSSRVEAPPRPAAAPATRAAPKVPNESSGPNHLSVADFGVGQRIEGRDLVGRVDRFEQWNVARFWTHVIGGEPGDLIHHVWLREGRVVQSIELELGAADWRTHSRKTLGQPGQWAVEARDLDGRVLARATFTCEAPGR